MDRSTASALFAWECELRGMIKGTVQRSIHTVRRFPYLPKSFWKVPQKSSVYPKVSEESPSNGRRVSLTQNAESEVNGDEDDIAVSRQYGAVVGIAAVPLVAVDKHHDWVLS